MNVAVVASYEPARTTMAWPAPPTSSSAVAGGAGAAAAGTPGAGTGSEGAGAPAGPGAGGAGALGRPKLPRDRRSPAPVDAAGRTAPAEPAGPGPTAVLGQRRPTRHRRHRGGGVA